MSEEQIILNNKSKYIFVLPNTIFDIYIEQIKHFPGLCENEKFINNLINLVKLQNELMNKYNMEE